MTARLNNRVQPKPVSPQITLERYYDNAERIIRPVGFRIAINELWLYHLVSSLYHLVSYLWLYHLVVVDTHKHHCWYLWPVVVLGVTATYP